jgi:arabinose-5-phosphate isomerase
MHHIGEDVVRIEAEALRQLADRLAGPMGTAFERAVGLLHGCTGRVVVTGMGKSGIVARKIAATLSSTGTPALFLHPAEAVHGDLGMVVRGDVVVALSSSGETEEILRLLATIKRLAVPLISFTGDAIYRDDKSTGESPVSTRATAKTTGGAGVSKQTIQSGSTRAGQSPSTQTSNAGAAAAAASPRPKLSTLAQAADAALDCSVTQEACTLGLSPTASTATMMALGDALAVALAQKRGFKEEDFANLHPGGKLGKRLARVSSVMHSGDAVPRVEPHTRMADVIYEMSRKGLGITTVVENGKLAGIISDGDLRRLLERLSKAPDKGAPSVLDLTAAECMTRGPKTIASDAFAASALSVMEQMKITSLVVVDAKGRVEGIVHLHDLWGTGEIW